MKESLVLGGKLFLITAICVGLLGFINNITTPIIKINKENKEKLAMQQIIKEADDFEEATVESVENITKLYVAKTAGKNIGFIAKAQSNGYGGAIEILIGLDENVQVKGIQILSHSETPGLGANATNESFTSQFVSKKTPIKVIKATTPSDDEIVAITGSTITSQAVTDGVNAAVDYVMQHQEELLKEVN